MTTINVSKFSRGFIRDRLGLACRRSSLCKSLAPIGEFGPRLGNGHIEFILTSHRVTKRAMTFLTTECGSMFNKTRKMRGIFIAPPLSVLYTYGHGQPLICDKFLLGSVLSCHLQGIDCSRAIRRTPKCKFRQQLF